MADHFDAYYKWLGIPPEEQPPNHYRLLGVRTFEADIDVIANAADQRMTHVRTFQSGKHGAQSQSLLNEISAAKLARLHAGRKAEYDVKLRGQLAAAAPPQISPPNSWPTSPPAVGPPPAVMAPPGFMAPGSMAPPRGIAPPPGPSPMARPVAYPAPVQAPLGRAPIVTAARAMPAVSTESDANFAELGQIQADSMRRRTRRKKKSPLGLVFVMLLLAAGAGAGAWWFLGQKPIDSASSDSGDSKPKPGEPTETERAAAASEKVAASREPEAEASGAGESHRTNSASGGDAENPSPEKKTAEAVPSATSHDAAAALLEYLKTVVTRENFESTAIVGAEEGDHFSDIHRGAILVGMDLYFATENVDRPTLCGVAGIFLGEKGTVSGRLHGATGNAQKKAKSIARPGYALAAIDLVANVERVAAIQLEYRQIGDRTLNRQNAYRSVWLGDATGGTPTKLGGDGRPVIGLAGSADAMGLYGLGLVLPPKLKPADEKAPRKTPGAEKSTRPADNKNPTPPGKTETKSAAMKPASANEIPVLEPPTPTSSFTAARRGRIAAARAARVRGASRGAQADSRIAESAIRRSPFLGGRQESPKR